MKSTAKKLSVSSVAKSVKSLAENQVSEIRSPKSEVRTPCPVLRHLSSGFSLVELMIVVAILGILAAIVAPELSGHSQKAKESAAKENLRILRNAIEVYAAQHNSVAPGYPNGSISSTPSWPILFSQLLKASNSSGQFANIGTPGYNLGPYLSDFPKNPFNGSKLPKMIGNAQDLPPVASGTFGWIYKPATREIRLDWPGIDSQGVSYYSY